MGKNPSHQPGVSELHFPYTHSVPTQQLLHDSAFCYEKQETVQHPRCCLKHQELILRSITAGIQTWTCQLHIKHHRDRATDCSGMDFQNHAVVLSNPSICKKSEDLFMCQKQAIRSTMWCLTTFYFPKLLPLHRDGTNCFAVTLWNITKIDSSPKQSDSRVAFLQHQMSLLNFRNLSLGSKVPLCQVQGAASAGGGHQSQQM